jgi:iron-sulfur cluster assembly protein
MNSFKITTEAAKKITENITKRKKGVGIRIGIRTTGCSGLAYTLEYMDDYPKGGTETYCVFHKEQAKVFIFGDDFPYLEGAELDYVKNGLNQGFEFHNPNVRDTCGCGESFRV